MMSKVILMVENLEALDLDCLDTLYARCLESISIHKEPLEKQYIDLEIQLQNSDVECLRNDTERSKTPYSFLNKINELSVFLEEQDPK